MVVCKRCGLARVVKSGVVAGKQRYQCKDCGCNFREGDQRANKRFAAKKALCILLYSMSKGSFRMMGRILGVDHTLAYRWIKDSGESVQGPETPGDIRHMDFDEMWHFIGSKKESFGSSNVLTVVQGELWPGCPAVVILQPSNALVK